MTRRSKGSPINGWVIVDKTAGHTSTAVVNKLKWLLNAQKAGHAGTLDPDATGILAIALGEATKTIAYLTNATKSYHFTVSLGSSTDTDDASGKVLRTSDYRPKTNALREVLQMFIGNIKQVPPSFSAVKIDGQRAYNIARKGEQELKLKERDLWVQELTVLERIDNDTVEMKMVCGKGGYVRSIGRDIGEKLGCFAHITKIRRISSGPFTLSDAISADIIFSENIEQISNHILPIQSTLKNLNAMECSVSEAKDIKNGKAIEIYKSHLSECLDIFITHNSTPIALGRIVKNKFHPKKVFVLA